VEQGLKKPGPGTETTEGNLRLTGMNPLWTIDVWEHAYYINCQNQRADYVHMIREKEGIT